MTTARQPVFTRQVTGFDVTPRDLYDALGDATGRRPTSEELRRFQCYMNNRLSMWLEESAALFANQYI